MDRNGDGALQGGEFILNESSMAKAIKKYFMLRRKAYSHLDQDGDGGVSSGEFAEMARVKFENADADGDGFLTEDEIVAFARGPGPNGDGG